MSNEFESEDIAQDVFVNVYFSVKKFRFESSFKTWLYRIIINRINNYISNENHINLENIDNYLIKELNDSSLNADLIIIDMIGPMELFSIEFCELIKKLLKQEKKILCAIQTKYNHPIIKEIKELESSKLYDLNEKHKVEVIDGIYKSIIEEFE